MLVIGVVLLSKRKVQTEKRIAQSKYVQIHAHALGPFLYPIPLMLAVKVNRLIVLFVKVMQLYLCLLKKYNSTVRVNERERGRERERERERANKPLICKRPVNGFNC
ncbi:hypothetical protein QOT17_008033 [Balamuthia mandrillaris]